MSAPTAQFTEQFNAYAEQAQKAFDGTVRAASVAAGTAVAVSFDVAQRVLDGQRAVVTAFLPKN